MSSSTTIPTEQVPAKAEIHHAPEPIRPSHRPGPKKGLSGPVKLVIAVVVLGVALAASYAVFGKDKVHEKAGEALEYVKHQVGAGPAPKPEPEAPAVKPKADWNGLVTIDEAKRETVGFRIATVMSQTEPIKLELNGTTDFDLNTLVNVRPRFDNALVQKVYVSAGQPVKKGDPLMDIKSNDLASKRNDCRTKYVQWDHDHKYLIAREPLAKEGRITQIIWTDTQNDEKKSRLDYFMARETLITYGMNNEQVDQLLEGLGDDKEKADKADDHSQDLTTMTVFSPSDGIVVKRDVVPGNYYDQTNLLLTISPMDQLWVWGNVFESDQDKVHLGQKCEILFQFSTESFPAKVESIASGVDPDTRTIRIRATIPNPGKNLSAGMLVRAVLQIAPLPGDTVIPRNGLSVSNGEYFAFVQKGETGDAANQFERRKLEIEKEGSEYVVVKKGLKAGDRIVTNGSLIVAQMYEDQAIVDTGTPSH